MSFHLVINIMLFLSNTIHSWPEIRKGGLSVGQTIEVFNGKVWEMRLCLAEWNVVIWKCIEVFTHITYHNTDCKEKGDILSVIKCKWFLLHCLARSFTPLHFSPDSAPTLCANHVKYQYLLFWWMCIMSLLNRHQKFASVQPLSQNLLTIFNHMTNISECIKDEVIVVHAQWSKCLQAHLTLLLILYILFMDQLISHDRLPNHIP
jgi:hypothetical protein